MARCAVLTDDAAFAAFVEALRDGNAAHWAWFDAAVAHDTALDDKLSSKHRAALNRRMVNKAKERTADLESEKGNSAIVKRAAAKHPVGCMRTLAGPTCSSADGRLIYAADGLNVLQAGKEPLRFDMSARAPLHLVPATRERLWYSYSTTKKLLAANGLVLAGIATPTVDEQRIDFGPERIVHLASSSGAVAALLFSAHEGPTPIEPVLRWTVVVIDEHGKERWRANVPSSFTPTFLLLNHCLLYTSPSPRD